MTGMKIIRPTAITSSMLTSSTVAEPDTGEVAWNPVTSYPVGAQVIRTNMHWTYERIGTGGVSAVLPESDSALWLPVGPTNRWRMFDRKIGTVTSAATTITAVMQPGGVSGIGALELVGREAVVTLKEAPGGGTVYSRTISLDGTLITSVYEWLFSEFEQLTDFVLTDLPQHFPSGELTVSITGTTGVSVGVLQVGNVLDVGGTIGQPTVGILDFSRKVRDQFGNFDVQQEGAYSKRGSIQVLTAKSDFNKIYRGIAALRATPCIYIAIDQIGYEPLISYGFFKEFSMVVAYANHHLCNLEIEGLI